MIDFMKLGIQYIFLQGIYILALLQSNCEVCTRLKIQFPIFMQPVLLICIHLSLHLKTGYIVV